MEFSFNAIPMGIIDDKSQVVTDSGYVYKPKWVILSHYLNQVGVSDRSVIWLYLPPSGADTRMTSAGEELKTLKVYPSNFKVFKLLSSKKYV